jgi:excinuclease ABC subunit B
LDRVEIIRELRDGVFDVLVGVNLLREGLDIPEVSLVAIMDADKEGFLRSDRSLTQTAGRAARNVNGRVIMYADTITESMARTIDETQRRRKKQEAFNAEHGIEPQQIRKQKKTIFEQSPQVDDRPRHMAAEPGPAPTDPVWETMSDEALEKSTLHTKQRMEAAAKELDFMEAARLRDEYFALKEIMDKRKAAQ